MLQEIEEAPPELDMSSLCVDEDDMQNMIQNGTGNVVAVWLYHIYTFICVLSKSAYYFLHVQNSFVDNGGDTLPTGVRYKVVELPVTLPYQKAPVDKPNPKQGVGK